MAAIGSNKVPGVKLYAIVWIGLNLIVGIEVLLTYQHLPTRELLTFLLVLAFVEAGLGAMYFMHLKYERRSLLWSLIPYLIFVLFMMDHIWPDAFRITQLRLPMH